MIATQGPGADSLRRVLDGVFAGRAYQWPRTATAEVPWWVRWVSEALRWLSALWHRITAAASGGFTFLPWILLVLVIAVAVHALFRMNEASRAAHDAGLGARRSPVLRRDEGWFVREADALAAAGRYGEAMVAAFHGAMLALERRGLVAYRASRTPSELARQATLRPDDERVLGGLVRQLYEVAFGGTGVDADDFRAWRSSLRRIADASAS